MITHNGHSEFEHVSRLELALVEYLDRRGMLDVDEWLGRYPDQGVSVVVLCNAANANPTAVRAIPRTASNRRIIRGRPIG